MATAVQQRYSVKGAIFGARGEPVGSSCTCDPCDCNPCNCGSSVYAAPNYPLWRVSGYLVRSGEIHDVDVTAHLILSLTQPVQEGHTDAWQEVILVDDRATDEQIAALLDLFEERLESVPAEVTFLPETPRAVYCARIHYAAGETHPILHVDFTPDPQKLIRGTENPDELPLRAWKYDGLMVLRETFDWQKD